MSSRNCKAILDSLREFNIADEDEVSISTIA